MSNQDYGIQIGPDGKPVAVQYVPIDRKIFAKELKTAEKHLAEVQGRYDGLEKDRGGLVDQRDSLNTQITSIEDTLDEVAVELEEAEEAVAFQRGRIETLDALASNGKAPEPAKEGGDAPSVDTSASGSEPVTSEPAAPAVPENDSNAADAAPAPVEQQPEQPAADNAASPAASSDDEEIPTADSAPASSSNDAATGAPEAGSDNSGDVPAAPAEPAAEAPIGAASEDPNVPADASAEVNTTADDIPIPVVQKAGF